MLKRKIRTKVMPTILKKLWYVNESGNKQSEKIFNSADFVRFSQVDKLLSDSLNLDGDVAELGVYRGRLTELIADKMLDTNKCLYLFDTFEGFKEVDVKIDQNKKHITGEVEDFSNTSMLSVFNKVSATGFKRENLVIRKGWFPGTLKSGDEEKRFCFVSIDFDLSAPTLSAINFFWPRVVKGGYVIIHDYGNINYKGVKDVIDRYIKENDIKAYFELCDYCGTMILKKI